MRNFILIMEVIRDMEIIFNRDRIMLIRGITIRGNNIKVISRDIMIIRGITIRGDNIKVIRDDNRMYTLIRVL